MRDIITMSQKEKKGVPIFEKLKRKEITQVEAGRLLGLSGRQVKRKIKQYIKQGIEGLIHKNRGRPGNRKIPEEKRRLILNPHKKQFYDFGPTFASEKFEELHGIKINPEMLRLWLQILLGIQKDLFFHFPFHFL